MTFRLLWLFLLWALPFVGGAQQLLWERIYNPPGAQNTYLVYCSLTPQGRLLVPGYTRPLGLSPCQGWQQVFSLYDLNGQLVREQLGRRQAENPQALQQGTGSRYWWAGTQPVCAAPISEGSYVQRLTLHGDTLPAWPMLAPVPPEHSATAVLEDGRRLLVAGYEVTRGANLQIRRYTLTSVDTASGQVRWRHAYDRPPFANDYPTDLVRTPKGGYLISGDGQLSAGFQHLFLETDSLGNQLKQRLIYPLGPNFNNGYRFSTWTNLLALPNAQGYLASGMADSTPGPGLHYGRAYLMRLDTALNVTWVYAHPPALDGQLSQDANRVRLLPDGSAALLVRDLNVRSSQGSFSPTLRLVQIDLTTGQRLSRYTLPSPSQTGIRVFDWQWLGDGTLVLCGQSTQAGTGVGVTQGYLARWDFRQTPLATGRPATQAGGASLRLYPTPGTTTAPTAAHYQLPPGTSGGTLLVTDVLGRLMQRHPLPPGPRSGSLLLPGLAPSLYLVRLVPTQGPTLTQRLLVQP
ncbi:hypothetical protein Q5H93_22395 [Hymenobacter sp. ASUV-10]|uniref:T9SS type A sorting domain-containing protein n=1 Tax=Hymenobacter aranciens TaxID=3063996 RepID=A0ABT9BGV6_9BACT|nr:hypothetical protein [Hymenobacter sp. ASUV-10]MDO7877506.1 hypothetical protein [Hymenobacter sp. ASUV-10]